MIRRSLIVAFIASFPSALVNVAYAQAPAAGTNPVGVWRGTSLCTVRPSPCHDEVVVYYITRANGSDSLTLDARKIVDISALFCRL